VQSENGLLIFLIALMVIFNALLLVAMLGIFKSLKQLLVSLERRLATFEGKITPLLGDVKERLDQAKDVIENLRKTTENFVVVSEMVKGQAEKVNVTLQETTDRARAQIAKADEIVSDVVSKIQVTADVIQQNILAPVREISALIRGVYCAMQILFGRRHSPIDRAHQDEELFI
jgi:uncharacterized protein YjbJ (UPF0337 family)